MNNNKAYIKIADRPMKITAELNSAGGSSGWGVYVVEQSTDAAVAENDTITFPGLLIGDCYIISMTSATGQVMNFDTKANVAESAGSSNRGARYTVDHQEVAASKHQFGTLADGGLPTSVKGLILAKNFKGYA